VGLGWLVVELSGGFSGHHVFLRCCNPIIRKAANHPSMNGRIRAVAGWARRPTHAARPATAMVHHQTRKSRCPRGVCDSVEFTLLPPALPVTVAWNSECRA